LKQAAVALHKAGQWSIVYDAQWRIAWLSDALVSILKFENHTSSVREHALAWNDSRSWGMNRQYCLDFGGFVLADMPGGKDELRAIACPEVCALIDEMTPNDDNVLHTFVSGRQLADVHVTVDITIIRLRDSAGTFVGAVYIQKPPGGDDALTLAAMTNIISPQMVHQMGAVLIAARWPAAILCADLDGWTPLSRHLSTANYFRLMRRWVFSAPSLP
jgi:hypothetical protein